MRAAGSAGSARVPRRQVRLEPLSLQLALEACLGGVLLGVVGLWFVEGPPTQFSSAFMRLLVLVYYVNELTRKMCHKISKVVWFANFLMMATTILVTSRALDERRGGCNQKAMKRTRRFMRMWFMKIKTKRMWILMNCQK